MSPAKAGPHDDVPTRVQIPLDPELRELIRVYMVHNDHSSPQAVIIELLHMSFASSPMDGAVKAGRMQAYRETMRLMLSRMKTFTNELQNDVGLKQSEVSLDEPGVI